MKANFAPNALDVPLLTTGEVARLGRVDVDTFTQWQKPGRKALGVFGEMTAAGRRLYSLHDATLLRLVAGLGQSVGVGPSEAAIAARGAMGELARIGARPLPAEPGKRLAALYTHNGDAWFWHGATIEWITASLIKGSPAEPQLILPVEEMRDAVVRAAIIYALAPAELDERAPRGAPSLAARLLTAGIRDAELEGKVKRELNG